MNTGATHFKESVPQIPDESGLEQVICSFDREFPKFNADNVILRFQSNMHMRDFNSQIGHNFGD